MRDSMLDDVRIKTEPVSATWGNKAIAEIENVVEFGAIGRREGVAVLA